MILYNSKDELEAAIRARTKLKKLKGELLSPLDEHLLKLCSQPPYSLKSLTLAFFYSLTFILKLTILTFCLLFIYGNYLQYEEQNVTTLENESDSISVEEYASPVSESSILAFNQDYNSELDKVSKVGEQIDPHTGLIQFIAGVIAVYIPEANNSSKLAKEIVTISKEEGMDPLFIASIISVESKFLSKATSHMGASGLMQLMPLTAKMLAEKFSDIPNRPKLTDTKINIALGIRYIKELTEMYKGNKRFALAAYNMGPSKLNKILSSRGRIPGSVERYAKTILEKSAHWNRHFEGVRG